MPRSKGPHKEALISTRVVGRIADAVEDAASAEGLTVSEWLRNLIIKELKERGLLGMERRLLRTR